MFVKVRHKPFSAYTYFKAPANQRGKEAIYIEGQNDGNLLGHGVGVQALVGTVRLRPDSMLAMRGNRYPITEIGVLNLTKRLVEVAEQDKKFGECEVKFFKDAKINNRAVTCIQVVHPVRRKNFRFHMARVFVDNELNIPIRFEAYDWPTASDPKPPLLEEYTYVDVKINPGLTDKDFDEYNKDYAFRIQQGLRVPLGVSRVRARIHNEPLSQDSRYSRLCQTWHERRLVGILSGGENA
jgi:hypothetical protein